MASKKITELTDISTSLSSDDVMLVVDAPSTSPSSKKVTVGALAAFAIASEAEINALASTTSAANVVPYFTGSGTATNTGLTAAGRALIDDADATAQRATLGLTIGTNVQAYDADLAAIAGTTSAADKVPYFTGVGTASTASFTAAGRAMTGASSATAQRTLISAQPLDQDLTDIAGITPVRGDILYRNATAWTKLAAGTSGQLLKTNGVADPAWVGTAWTTYTPTHNLTLGAGGTIVGQYTRVANMVTFQVAITFGTSPTVNATSTYITTPTPAASGWRHGYDTVYYQFTTVPAGGRYRPGKSVFKSAADFYLFSINDLSPDVFMQFVTNTLPTTWAVSDQIWVMGTYPE